MGETEAPGESEVILKQGSKWRKQRASWIWLIYVPRERQLSNSSGRLTVCETQSSLVSHSIFMVTFLTLSHRVRSALLLPPQTLKIWHQNNLSASSVTTQSPGARFPELNCSVTFWATFWHKSMWWHPQPKPKAWLYLFLSSGLPSFSPLPSSLPALLPSTNHLPRASHVARHNLLNLENKT